MGLEAAVEATAESLNKAVKPVSVGGPKLRVAKACEAFVKLADASGYALAVMPSAKGLKTLQLMLSTANALPRFAWHARPGFLCQIP
ncbi:hypothetical protein QQP08_016524 [Theobroma cacao]|nr:hypothetical protein QQP08_016524 [Theobroma cacao]